MLSTRGISKTFVEGSGRSDPPAVRVGRPPEERSRGESELLGIVTSPWPTEDPRGRTPPNDRTDRPSTAGARQTHSSSRQGCRQPWTVEEAAPQGGRAQGHRQAGASAGRLADVDPAERNPALQPEGHPCAVSVRGTLPHRSRTGPSNESGRARAAGAWTTFLHRGAGHATVRLSQPPALRDDSETGTTRRRQIRLVTSPEPRSSGRRATGRSALASRPLDVLK